MAKKRPAVEVKKKLNGLYCSVCDHPQYVSGVCPNGHTAKGNKLKTTDVVKRITEGKSSNIKVIGSQTTRFTTDKPCHEERKKKGLQVGDLVAVTTVFRVVRTVGLDSPLVGVTSENRDKIIHNFYPDELKVM